VSNSGSLWSVMAGNPLRFLRSRWPWRSLVYLAGSVLAAGLVWFVVLPGLLVAPALALLGLPVGALERRRLRLFDRIPTETPHTVPPPGPGAWLRRRLGEGATWRELGYTVCLSVVLVVVDLCALFLLALSLLLLTLPLWVAVAGPSQLDIQVWDLTVGHVSEAFLVAGAVGLPATVAAIYGLCLLAGGQAAFARWLLAPTGAELDRRLRDLARSRARLVDAFAAERRRIERDLHDGAQQHLVLLSMTLGLAEVELGAGAGRAGTLVTEAHHQARHALTAIRELIHGIHPQTLTDLGLEAAVGELAERCQVPVEIDLRLGRRLASGVESAAYFVVSEALTNVVRHARASRITVSGRIAGERLVLVVTDDGVGGAEPARGSGLRGLADRAAVLDGTLVITSPIGGPTMLRVELPCHFE
jgi:signal transduction histidine kinase